MAKRIWQFYIEQDELDFLDDLSRSTGKPKAEILRFLINKAKSNKDIFIQKIKGEK